MRRGLPAATLALATVGLALTSCGEPKPSSPTPADIAAIDMSPDHTIVADDDGFDPASIEVEAGEVLLLVNRGTGLHSFTAEERFDTGRMHPGDETTLVLTEPGEIPYRDLENPEHEGSITIVERGDRG